MRLISPEEIENSLDYPTLIEQLRASFRSDIEIPTRHHHTLPTSGSDATLLLMPAWKRNQYIGIKIATVFPDNADHKLPTVMARYLLLDGQTGQPLAQMDGRLLTAKRTAAASALAASYLARTNGIRMLMIGAGALARPLIQAHTSILPIQDVLIWNRTPEKASQLALTLRSDTLYAKAVTDLKAAIESADLISCATLSQVPLIKGRWLKPGTHVDLVGGFTPDMRETDDEAIRKARIFVDTRTGATNEAGDIVQPLRSGLITQDHIIGDLFDLTRNTIKGRTSQEEITLFKSVGTALEDLAAAELVYERIAHQ